MAERPAVDGAIGDWGGRLTSVQDQSVSVGALPTDSLLYVAVVIRDQALLRSLAANGLVLWVDPSGGQQRAYGVQYPLGLRRQQAGQAPSGGAQNEAVGIDDVSFDELEVVRGDSLRERIPADFALGLRATGTLDPGSLIYEVAIPVSSSPSEHRLRGLLGETVGLGLHIPEPEDDDESGVEGGQNIGSVTGAGRRGRRGRRGGRRRGQQRQRQQQSTGPEFETLDLWMTVPNETGR